MMHESMYQIILIGVEHNLALQTRTSLQNFLSSNTLNPFRASALIILNVISCASCVRADAVNWAVWFPPFGWVGMARQRS